MTDRRATEDRDFVVTFDPLEGWRCTCPQWYDDGWGCEHTERAELAALEARLRAPFARPLSDRGMT
jgi:hypothetical protein